MPMLAGHAMSPTSMVATMQLCAPQQLFAFGVLGHDRGQMPNGEFERRLSVSPSKSSALKAVGDGVVSFAVDTHFACMLCLGGAATSSALVRDARDRQAT
jgi:hypothetical protein